MENEIKYSVPDQETLRRLAAATELAGLSLAAPRTARVRDVYLDTAGCDFLAAGYSLRIRSKGGKVIAALKSLEPAKGALHSRVELETTIEPGTGAHPDSWPGGPAAELAMRIGGGKPMEALFELVQERQTRLASGSGLTQPAVELSLDTVWLAGSDESFYEVEAEELLPGQEELLASLHAVLAGEWGLQPQPLSKFERALQAQRPDLVERLPRQS